MCKEAPPKWVVFDVMRVLVEWDPDRLYRRLIPDQAERAAFFSRTGLPSSNLDATRSGDLRGKVAALAELYPEDAHLILPWWDRWTEMCYAPIPEVGDFLRRLKSAGIPVCCLSNFSDDAFEIARGRYSVLREFDAEVISCRIGVTKPDPRIYAWVEERTGVAGGDLFFIDDKPNNVDSARTRGWRPHLFEGWDGLAASLPEVGLGCFASPDPG
ncbi:MAG: HAD family phosphatase [Rhodobacteraceae bacterium]|nr:HAD family phosphatase [Paracoccaceae bacterium]